MKKILMVALAAIISFSPSFAQSKQEIKAAKKEAKAAAKQLKRDGFQMLELGDLQTQLQNYFLKVKSGCTQMVGTAEGCMTINLGKVTALNNAITEYATLDGGVVKGRITSNLSNIDGAQIDNIVAAYERLVMKEIKNEVQSCITLVKEKKKAYDVRAYCLIDFDAAASAKQKAMSLALKELQLSQEYGSKVSNWIDEGQNKAK